MSAADLPTTRREALLALRNEVQLLAGDPRFEIPGVLELILVTANSYPAAEEHIDPVPHDPDLPRDLGSVERGACGAVIPPLGDICLMQPGHRDHVRTGALAAELDQARAEITRLNAGAEPPNTDRSTRSTPGQWLGALLEADGPGRLAAVQALQEQAESGYLCLVMDHQSGLGELQRATRARNQAMEEARACRAEIARLNAEHAEHAEAQDEKRQAAIEAREHTE
jgi:hypothetical protein